MLWRAMCDELVKIAKMRHEEQRYVEYTYGHGRGGIGKATPEQEAEGKRVMGELRTFLGGVSRQAKDKGMLKKLPREMHIPIGKGHTAMVQRMPHGLVAKTVYDSSYKTGDKPVVSRKRLQGMLRVQG